MFIKYWEGSLTMTNTYKPPSYKSFLVSCLHHHRATISILSFCTPCITIYVVRCGWSDVILRQSIISSIRKYLLFVEITFLFVLGIIWLYFPRKIFLAWLYLILPRIYIRLAHKYSSQLNSTWIECVKNCDNSIMLTSGISLLYALKTGKYRIFGLDVLQTLKLKCEISLVLGL